MKWSWKCDVYNSITSTFSGSCRDVTGNVFMFPTGWSLVIGKFTLGVSNINETYRIRAYCRMPSATLTTVPLDVIYAYNS